MNVKKIIIRIILLNLLLMLVGCNKKNVDFSEGVQGTVLSFNQQGMQLEIAQRWEDEEGEISVTGSDDNEIKDIYFDDNTTFNIHKNSGITGDEELEIIQGNRNDLENSGVVIVFGETIDGEVVASKVEIWKFTE